MVWYLTRTEKSLQRLAVSHAIPAGSREVTAAVNFISERTVFFVQVILFNEINLQEDNLYLYAVSTIDYFAQEYNLLLCSVYYLHSSSSSIPTLAFALCTITF
jgi:hypothetical protein